MIKYFIETNDFKIIQVENIYIHDEIFSETKQRMKDFCDNKYFHNYRQGALSNRTTCNYRLDGINIKNIIQVWEEEWD